VTPRLFWQIASLEARTRMSYRVDFWLNVAAGFLVEFGIAWYLWRAVFDHATAATIGGYDFSGMVVYYLAVILLGKLVRTNRFEGAVSGDIYEGGLNRYIVFPAPYFPFKYAQHLGTLVPAALQFLLFGGLTLFVLHMPPEMAPTLPGLAMALAALALGNLLYYILDYAVQLIAFWADNVWSLDVAKWFVASLLGGYMVPLSVFPDGLRGVLEVLPFRFFFDFPARALTNQMTVGEWAAGMALGAVWCIVFAAAAAGIWSRGRLRYTGVGI
jgi:ABC-2 type transport system permease protein